MKDEIIGLEQDISKSVNEIAKVFELKYRDFVPHFLTLADCQEKIQSTLTNGSEKLKKFENQLLALEKSVSTAEENSPLMKLDIIRDFIDRLTVLSEMESCLNSVWSAPETRELGRDLLTDVQMIIRLEELSLSLHSDNSSYLEAVNDRILPLLFTEIQTRKSELYQQLDDFYKKFFNFPDIERINPGVIELAIANTSFKLATESFTAMKKLGLFEERLEEMVDAIWKIFCVKIIQSAEPPESILTFRANELNERIMVFGIKKSVTCTKTPDPNTVFSALTMFFGMLHKSLKNINVETRPLLALFGERICARLICSLETDCLIPAIPWEKTEDNSIYEGFVLMTNDFVKSMKEKGFFSESIATNLFTDFFASYDRILTDRRCHNFMISARELIVKPYIHLTQVGSSTDESEEKIADIMDKLAARKSGETSHLAKKPDTDTHFLKKFQFQRCKISTSTYELVDLVSDVLKAAANSDSDIEASRLLTTAQNILETFVTLAPKHHRQTLGVVPQVAAIFFNNCHYICHRLMTIQTDLLPEIVKTSKLTEKECTFVDLFANLRSIAADTLEQHIIQARRQLSVTIGDDDTLFVGLRDDATFSRCKRTMNACILQIEQVSGIWKEVMSEVVLMNSLGALGSHLLTILANVVLAKEDIASTDAEITAELLSSLINSLRQILTINQQSMIHRVCEEPYYKMVEIIFCLKGNLAEIGHRWCEGKGPLALWLKPSQVKQLVRALFQNTDRRAQLLSTLNN